ncbi:hypothetical protein K439DRAFT_1641945, partial [Ramaria rubella]
MSHCICTRLPPVVLTLHSLTPSPPSLLLRPYGAQVRHAPHVADEQSPTCPRSAIPDPKRDSHQTQQEKLRTFPPPPFRYFRPTTRLPIMSVELNGVAHALRLLMLHLKSSPPTSFIHPPSCCCSLCVFVRGSNRLRSIMPSLYFTNG